VAIEQLPPDLDVALGFTIPARHARGRVVRLGPALERSCRRMVIRRLIEKLLAEALTLAALLGSTLKDAEGQLTLQAQTEGGASTCWSRLQGGEMRGYVAMMPTRLAEIPAIRRCSRCSARAIWRSPSIRR
jgi:molecular chaperone Hsp33